MRTTSSVKGNRNEPGSECRATDRSHFQTIQLSCETIAPLGSYSVPDIDFWSEAKSSIAYLVLGCINPSSLSDFR